eukprot:3677788-Rhodomonas_salina.1
MCIRDRSERVGVATVTASASGQEEGAAGGGRGRGRVLPAELAAELRQRVPGQAGHDFLRQEPPRPTLCLPGPSPSYPQALYPPMRPPTAFVDRRRSSSGRCGL